MRRRIYDKEGHAHFITFSCYKRRRLLDDDRAKRAVLDHLAAQLQRTDGRCAGFVVMPNHVHAIVWHPKTQTLADFMKQWKRISSYRIARLPAASQRPNPFVTALASDPVWQPRYYDFNLFSPQKIEEKLSYMHENPVRAGLVTKAEHWTWSSARFYAFGEEVGVPIRRID